MNNAAILKAIAKHNKIKVTDDDISSLAPLVMPDKTSKPAVLPAMKTPSKQKAVPVTQHFGDKSDVEPQSGGVNYGTDYATAQGTPIPFAGKDKWKVIDSYNQADPQGGNLNNWDNQGYGNSVVVKNQRTGAYLRLSHLSDVNVSPGDIIDHPMEVGKTGSSGHVTGPHLDMEYYDANGNIGNVEDTPYADLIPRQSNSPQAPLPQLAPTPANPKATLPAIQSYDEFVDGTPDIYKPLIAKASRENGVPSKLFSALLKQESGFNPQAQSPVGAQGIAQFMPDTASGMGVDPMDPASAIPGAAAYLSKRYKKYNDWKKTLASYNAGEGAVDQYGDIPPFPETQQYVQNIFQMAGMK